MKKKGILVVLTGCVARLTCGQETIEDFENGSSGWQFKGDGFTVLSAPASVKKIPVKDQQGLCFLSSGTDSVKTKGAVQSPEFIIKGDYLNFLVGGDRIWPDELGVQLLIESNVVRSAAGRSVIPAHDRDLEPMTWDVRELQGKKAVIRVVDHSDLGVIYCDAFTLSNEPISPPSDATVRFAETFRPRYHFTAAQGWTADPDGPIFYKGLWRICHQYGFVGACGRAWGQAVSDDLVHWKYLKPALLSDPTEYQQFLSGGGAVDWKNDSGFQTGTEPPLLLFYASVPTGPKQAERWTPGMAYSTDGGETWKQSPNNPLFTTKDFNDRDPRAFRYEPTGEWFLLYHLSNNNQKEGSSFGLYRSKDFKNWTLIQNISDFWENPDLFPLSLDGHTNTVKWVMMESRGTYKVGMFDGKQFTPETELIQNHFGGNYYGGGTFSDVPGGRRVQMAWMNTGRKSEKSYPGMPFVEQMTFPTELTLRTTPSGPRLRYWPTAEIEKIHGRKIAWKDRALPEGTTVVSEVQSNLLDLRLVMKPGLPKRVGLKVRGQLIIYDPVKQELYAPQDDRFPYLNDGMCLHKKPVPLKLQNGLLDLRILVDTASIEIFAQDGSLRFSFVFYPPADAPKLELISEGGESRLISLEAFELVP